MPSDTQALAVTLAERVETLQRKCAMQWDVLRRLYEPTTDAWLPPGKHPSNCPGECAGRGWVPVTDLAAVLDALGRARYLLSVDILPTPYVGEGYLVDVQAQAPGTMASAHIQGTEVVATVIKAVVAATEEAHSG